MSVSIAAGTIRVGGKTVLRDVDFAAYAATLTALVGPNGAGKTTLLRALAGLLPDGKPADPRLLAYVPQGARSAWGLTVREIASLGRIPHNDDAAAPVTEALRACGVIALQDERIDRISGGQARRAMLARALATEAETLLLDEPTADLDPAAAHEIMALLRRLAHAGRTVIVVLHAVDLALRYADRMVVLDRGRIVADAAPVDALPAAATAFGLPYGSDPSPRLLPP
jgi:iron complex transport system ATP-binding protein